ncbi:MAG: SBBP repeat-containing protein [Acidobacteria bacterium]|nr:SBBP repeat-containing protein [Acidobacteriota bacterium]
MQTKIQGFVAAITTISTVLSMIVTGSGMGDASSAFDKNQIRLPLLFETNKGQTDKEAAFIARAGGYTVYLTRDGAVFDLKHVVGDDRNDETPKTGKTIESDRLKMNFIGANEATEISGDSEAITRTNYYFGDKKFENLSNYRRANYRKLYDGIDAVFYGNSSGQLEYDFNVAPNADPKMIKIGFEGAKNFSIDGNGSLIVETENTSLVQQKPVAHQTVDGERREIAVSYRFTADSEIGFELGSYDASLPLVIDPALKYLTYIGGTAFDDVFEVAADNQGNAYISGQTASLNFHGEVRNDNDADGAYVAKVNAAGTDFVYVTILEGNGDDTTRGIALDASNNLYATGIASHFFPTTSGAYDTTHGVINNNDVFVAKLNTTGGLVYSSFLGGNDADAGFDVVVDTAGKAYVVGSTYSATAFPTKNKYQGCGFAWPSSLDSEDAFLTVMNSTGSDITYSTCIGGAATDDNAFSVALDASNNAYLTGLAKGGNFPTKNAFQPSSAGGNDGWVAKFNAAASGEASLVYSTYIGGTGTDQGNGVVVNASGQAVVVGLTGSANFPLVGAFDSTNQINEGFVAVISSTGTSLVNSSFIGGADTDNANNVALDPSGSIYITGNTKSNDFPMALPFQAARRGVKDAFFAKVKFGRGVISSSYIGGNGDDNGDGIAVKGNFVYVGGDTASTNLLTTPGVIKATTDNSDGFLAKILDTRLDSVGVFRPASTFLLTQSTTNIVSQTATLSTNLAGSSGVSGDFNGDGLDSTGTFTNGTWKVRDANFPLITVTPKQIAFGTVGDLPIVGDWNNDGIDTPGVFRPSTGQFFLTNSTSTAPTIDIVLNFGLNGDLPVAGDWNADGFDTVGVFRPSASNFFLTNSETAAAIDISTFFGVAEDLPIAGDWDGNGTDSIGVRRPSTSQFFLSNDNSTIAKTFVFGIAGDQPIVGDWDGRPLP